MPGSDGYDERRSGVSLALLFGLSAPCDASVTNSGEGDHLLFPGYQVQEGEAVEVIVAACPSHVRLGDVV